jgi:hypothetical protein
MVDGQSALVNCACELSLPARNVMAITKTEFCRICFAFMLVRGLIGFIFELNMNKYSPSGHYGGCSRPNKQSQSLVVWASFQELPYQRYSTALSPKTGMGPKWFWQVFGLRPLCPAVPNTLYCPKIRINW